MYWNKNIQKYTLYTEIYIYRDMVCCSVLQCVAVCCSVLQCVAVCCSDRYVGIWICANIDTHQNVTLL